MLVLHRVLLLQPEHLHHCVELPVADVHLLVGVDRHPHLGGWTLGCGHGVGALSVLHASLFNFGVGFVRRS